MGGRTVPDAQLAAVAGLDDGRFEVAVRAALHHHVLVAEGAGYRFRHAILTEAVADDLLPREQARLLRILRVEAHAVRAHRMSALHEDRFTGLQLLALRQRLFEARRGVAAVQPVDQQGLQAGIVQAKQIGQARRNAAEIAFNESTSGEVNA